MKEVDKLLAQYVGVTERHTKRDAAEWFKSTHPALWQDYMEEAANRQLLSDVARICNAATKVVIDPSGDEQLLLNEIESACPGLPRKFSVPNADGTVSYVLTIKATREDVNADIAMDDKQISDYGARVQVKKAFLRLMDEKGVPTGGSFSDLL